MRKLPKEIKEEEWQKVRRSLIGNWKKRPEWCCRQLRNYLGPIKTAPYEKLIIVLNYLTGTGFRTGNIQHPCITKLKLEIVVEIKSRKNQKINR
ncbi:MAG TPA: hypothetical protein PLA60_03260 [Candidatus Pacearchaeota archaeon]|jgi:hypothetical protein|nr:hypothetical protein [Candidatus Pacearchaeota archaeon]